MRLTDTIKTIEITMRTWDGLNYSPDFAIDFFEAPYSAELDAYVVDDVDYCIDQAKEWAAENEETNVVSYEEVA